MPTPALMVDTRGDVRPLIGHLGLTGCVATARYLFAGATVSGTDATVPQAVAAPLTADEVAGIRAAGLALLPVANNFGWGDESTPEVCAAKVRQAVARAQAIGIPAGVYLAWDLETWAFAQGCVAAMLAAARASIYGGAGFLYCNPGSAVVPEWQALRGGGDGNAARALLWIARYAGPWTGTPPAWDPGVDDPAVGAWQFCDQGPKNTDLSLLRLPLLSIGGTAEGLLLPDGTVGSPTLPDVADAMAAISHAQTALQAVRTALSR